MKNKSTRNTLPVLALGLATLVSHAQTTIFTESFDSIPEIQIDFNMQLGGDPEQKPSNTKLFPYGQWGMTANGGFVDVGGANGNALQPQLDGKNNGRVAAIFLDPALFAATGAGTYSLTFDVVASSSPGAGRVYVGAGSGYDLSGSTNAKLSLPLSPAGFGVKKVDGTAAWTGLTGANGATASHLTTTNTEWILADETATGEFRDVPGVAFDVETSATVSVNFEYDGSSALVVAFGGYNTDYKVDNISVSTAAPAVATWAGYSINKGYIDSAGFMGWLEVTKDPWIWSLSLSKYIYMPEQNVGESGAWGYFPK